MDDSRDSQGMLDLICRYCKKPFKAISRRPIYCDVCKHAGRQALYRERISFEKFKQDLTDEKADFITYIDNLQATLKRIIGDYDQIKKDFRFFETDKELDESDRAYYKLALLTDLENAHIDFENILSLDMYLQLITYINFIALSEEEVRTLYYRVSEILPGVTFQSDLEDSEDDGDEPEEIEL